MTRGSHDFRNDMLPLVPTDARRILDVGCSVGNFGRLLNEHRRAEIWGIDPQPEPRGEPSPYVERVTGLFPADMPPMDEQFDCVTFNDVLEHMHDPAAALVAARSMLTRGGVVLASIPNVRHLSVLKPLVLRGRWDYVDKGVLDRTHLRFFTRTTMIELFRHSGFSVTSVEPRWLTGGRWGTLNRRLGGRLDELMAHQFALVAHPA